ncbi:uncharacterized protein HKW66_Vig0230670 [Vigna angularis]|uniref:Uncharacterized protein n=1 Tax=Phaseolus angularis TaxID=3914 RepID=A0A8T0KD47_PHAAN|nr:uncharacterized protein HKW66_Vig0230670 [Vigna angularis]
MVIRWWCFVSTSIKRNEEPSHPRVFSSGLLVQRRRLVLSVWSPASIIASPPLSVASRVCFASISAASHFCCVASAFGSISVTGASIPVAAFILANLLPRSQVIDSKSFSIFIVCVHCGIDIEN